MAMTILSAYYRMRPPELPPEKGKKPKLINHDFDIMVDLESNYAISLAAALELGLVTREEAIEARKGLE